MSSCYLMSVHVCMCTETSCRWKARSSRCSDWVRAGTTTTTHSPGTTKRPSWDSATTSLLPCWICLRAGAGCMTCDLPVRPWFNTESQSVGTEPTPCQQHASPLRQSLSFKTKRLSCEKVHSSGGLDSEHATIQIPCFLAFVYSKRHYCIFIIYHCNRGYLINIFVGPLRLYFD